LRRFTTFEKFEDSPLVVVKKEGQREEFSRSKMMDGMLRACEKRPISTEQIEDAAYAIEKILRNSHEREVSSAQVGEAVLEHGTAVWIGRSSLHTFYINLNIYSILFK